MVEQVNNFFDDSCSSQERNIRRIDSLNFLSSNSSSSFSSYNSEESDVDSVSSSSSDFLDSLADEPQTVKPSPKDFHKYLSAFEIQKETLQPRKITPKLFSSIDNTNKLLSENLPYIK